MASIRVSEDLKARIKAEREKHGFKKESEVINKWMVKENSSSRLKQLKQKNLELEEKLCFIKSCASDELYDNMEKTTKLLSDWLDRVVVPASLHREVFQLVKENEKLTPLIMKNEILTMKDSVQSAQISEMKQSYDEVSSSIQSILKLGDLNG